jgi:hypothetical protein
VHSNLTKLRNLRGNSVIYSIVFSPTILHRPMSAPPETSGFYYDPEVLGAAPPVRPHAPEPLAPDLFAYLRASSFCAATFSLSIGGGSATTPQTPPRSLPDIAAGRSRPGAGGVVHSEQVGAFWERYNAYPRYLKNLTKRKKRRERKARDDGARA